MFDDVSNRIVGSAKVEDFLDKEPHEFETGQEVDVMIYGKSDIGYKVIINNKWTGVVYFSSVFQGNKKRREDERVHTGNKARRKDKPLAR